MRGSHGVGACHAVQTQENKANMNVQPRNSLVFTSQSNKDKKLTISARNQVERVAEQIKRNSHQNEQLKKLTSSTTDRSWNTFYKDFIAFKVENELPSSPVIPSPGCEKMKTRNKLLKCLLSINKREEFYNLPSEIQRIFNLIDFHKQAIIDENLSEDIMNSLSNDVRSDLESKTTRGLVDSFFQDMSSSFNGYSHLPNYPQMNFLPDSMNVPRMIQNMLGDFTSDLKSTLPDKQLLDKLMEALGSLTQNVDSKFSSFSWFLPMIGSIVGGTNFFVSGCKTSLTLCIICTVYLLFFHWDKIGEPVMDLFLKFYSVLFKSVPDEEVEMENLPQMSTDNLIDTSVVVLSGIFNFIVPGATTKSTFDFVSSYARGRNGLMPMMKSLIAVLETCLNKAMASFPGWKYYSFLKTNHFELDIWLEEARKIISDYNLNTLIRNSTNGILLHDLVKRGEDLFKQLPRTSETNNWCSLIMKDLTELKKISQDYSKFTKEGSRVETVGILIRGGPGVHKTIVMQAMSKLLALQELPQELRDTFDANASDYVHVRVPGATFEDGFSDKAIVQCIDDYAQAVDVPGIAGEFIHTIHACSPFPYNVNMADLKDKGKVFYKAKYMLCTSNAVTLRADSIISTDALLRRFPVDVIQTVKPEFCTEETKHGDIWHRKPKHPVIETAIDFSIFEFHVGKETNGSWDTSEIIDFPELFKRITLECRKRERHYELNKESIESLMHLVAFPQSSERTYKEEDDYVEFLISEGENVYSPIRRDLLLLMSQHYSREFPFNGSTREYCYHLVDCYGLEPLKTFFRESEFSGVDEARILRFMDQPRASVKSFIFMKPTFYQDTLAYLEGFYKDAKFWGLYLFTQTPRIAVYMGLLGTATYLLYPILVKFAKFITSFFETSKEQVVCEEVIDEYPCQAQAAMFTVEDSGTQYVAFQFSEEEFGKVRKALPTHYGKLKFVPSVFSRGIPHCTILIDQVLDKVYMCSESFGRQVHNDYSVDEHNNFVAFIKRHPNEFDKFWRTKKSMMQIVDPSSAHNDAMQYYSEIAGRYRTADESLRENEGPPMEGSPQSFGHSDKLKRGPKLKTVVQSFGHSDKLKSTRSFMKVKPQMTCVDDPTAFDVANKVYFKNSFLLDYRAPTDTDWCKAGLVVFPRDRIGLMPYHFLKTFMEFCKHERDFSQGKVRLIRPGNADPTAIFSIGDFMSYCIPWEEGIKQDLVMFQLPSTFQRVSNITKSFYLEKDYQWLRHNVPVMGMFRVNGHNVSFKANARLQTAPIQVGSTNLSPRGVLEGYEVARTLVVNLNTTAGDCGTLYTAINRATEGRKILAIHVSGNSMVGYGSFVYQEFLESYYSRMPDQTTADIPDLPMSVPQISHDRMLYVGDISPAPSHSVRSTIIKSAAYGSLGTVTTAPSSLRPVMQPDGTVSDPWLNAVKNYCQPVPDIDIFALDEAVEDFRVFLKSNKPHKIQHRILSLYEALEGVENELDFAPLKGNTSPGYPMNLSKDLNLKKKYFSFPQGSTERADCFKEIEVLVNDALGLLEVGVVPFFPCVDNLKDERRSIEKVKAASTRMFSGTPFIYLLICRMYFGTFLLEVHKNRITNGMAIGAQVYSGEWHNIAMNLKEHLVDDEDKGVGAGDYKSFDGSQNSVVMMKILDIIQDTYDDEHFSLRSLLFESMVHSYHIIKGQVYYWNGSLPSGHLLTALVNCMTNHINFRYCWVKAGLDISLFSASVYLIVMGDDNLFSVAPMYRDVFNEMKLAHLMSLIGMTYTTEFKGTATAPFRSLLEPEFLKRTFLYDPITNEYVAPLRLSVILDMPNWTRSGGMRQVIAASNLSTAHLELSLHTKETFDFYHAKFIQIKEEFYDEVNFAFPIYSNYFSTRTKIRSSIACF